MLKKDQAICIRVVDYSETSQVITLLGREHGKFDAIAKGAKRPKSPFDGPFEVFSYGHVVFSEAAGAHKLSSVVEFNKQLRFRTLRKTLEGLNCGLFGAELIEVLTDEFDPHPRLFDILAAFLEYEQSHTDHKSALAGLIRFQLALLRETGSGLVLDECVNCRRAFDKSWTTVHFSASGHGFVCRDCEAAYVDKIKLSKATASVLAQKQSALETDERSLEETERVLISYFTDVLHKPPKMAKYFLQTKK
jgi:DNA repair protein RecO (recombination protein O)